MELSNQNVIHIKREGIEFLQFKKLLEYQEMINHAYSVGIDKNYRTARANQETLTNQEYEKAIQDYNQLCKKIDTNYIHLVKTNQAHTDEVKIVTEKIEKDKPDFNLEQYKKTDGLITKQKNIVLSTTNADCILLLFFDPVQKVIANVHSGWKGTLQRIAVKTVKKMEQEYHCKVEDIICCICPSIRKCHFEVEKEVKDKFEKEFQDLEEIGKTGEIKEVGEIIEEKIPNQKWNIDTVKINQILLEKEGLKKENIIDSGICSVCHSDKIHSYRVEKQGYGLNTALIELK